MIVSIFYMISKHIFELSKLSNPNFYLPSLNLGRLYLESADLSRAIDELERARYGTQSATDPAETLAKAFAKPLGVTLPRDSKTATPILPELYPHRV